MAGSMNLILKDIVDVLAIVCFSIVGVVGIVATVFLICVLLCFSPILGIGYFIYLILKGFSEW